MPKFNNKKITATLKLGAPGARGPGPVAHG